MFGLLIEKKIRDHQCYKLTLFPHAHYVHQVLKIKYLLALNEQHFLVCNHTNQAPPSALPRSDYWGGTH